MRTRSLPSIGLSLLLQFLPLVRTVTSEATLAATPIIAILRTLIGAAAVAGSYHAVSGASISVIQPPNSQVTRTNGVASSFRLSLTWSDGRKTLSPQLYTAENLPPGFDQPTKSGSIWRITCNPTQTGVFDDVRITGWEGATIANSEHSATIVIQITVIDGAPVISSQPVSTSVSEGASASLSVSATGSNLSYQWRKGDLELSGETGPTLTFNPVSKDNEGTYQVFVSNSGGGVLSDPAVLTVTAAVEKPTFTLLPLDTTAYESEAVVLKSAASGPGTLTYQWFRGNQPIDGATGQNLTIPSVNPDDAGNYSVAVTGSGGTTTSPTAALAVIGPLAIGSILQDANTLRVSFNGIIGRQYVLEGSGSVINPQWNEKAQAVGGNGDVLVAPVDGTDLEVYRVRSPQP